MAVTRHICKACGKEFANERGLSIHQSSHSRVRIECPKCGKRVMYIETHLRKAHAQDTEKLLASLTDALKELEELRTENAVLREDLAERSRNDDH